MNTFYLQAYFTYMKDVALLMGADEAETEKQMLETLKFELELAKISLPRYLLMYLTYHYHYLLLERKEEMLTNCTTLCL